MTQLKNPLVSVSENTEFNFRVSHKLRGFGQLVHQQEIPSVQSDVIYLVGEDLMESMSDRPVRKVAVLNHALPTRIAHLLDQGFDEVLTLDCDSVVWVARLRKLAKQPRSNMPETEEFGPLRLNHAQQRAFCLRADAWLPVELTSLEFRVLHQLCRQPGKPWDRKYLHQAVWGANVHLSLRNIDTHVCKIRQKINHPDITIESTRGLGYRLIVPQNPAPKVAEFLPFRGIA